MTEHDYLDSLHISEMCSSAIEILESNNDNLEYSQQTLKKFADDVKLLGDSYKSLKQQISDYDSVIYLMIRANDSDISDYSKLMGTLSSGEVWDGDEILSEQRSASDSESEYRNKADNYRRLASQGYYYCGVFVQAALSGYYLGMANLCDRLADNAHSWFLMWKAKEDRYDEIEVNTSGLLLNGQTAREVAVSSLDSISQSFSNGQYNPDLSAKWRLELDIASLELRLASSQCYNEQNELQKVIALKKEELELVESGHNGGDIRPGETAGYGHVLDVPGPGDEITVSIGVGCDPLQRVVSGYNAWSIEYSIAGCNLKYPQDGHACTRRLNYAVNTYDWNDTGEADLLEFDLSDYGYGECYAGAMVEGYANIGDVVQVTLETGETFNFLILDVKSTSHTAAELAKDNQCQNEWGHGYLRDNDRVQLSVCEFIVTEKTDSSAINYPGGGELLTKHYVVQAEIIGNVYIDSDYMID